MPSRQPQQPLPLQKAQKAQQPQEAQKAQQPPKKIFFPHFGVIYSCEANPPPLKAIKTRITDPRRSLNSAETHG